MSTAAVKKWDDDGYRRPQPINKRRGAAEGCNNIVSSWMRHDDRVEHEWWVIREREGLKRRATYFSAGGASVLEGKEGEERRRCIIVYDSEEDARQTKRHLQGVLGDYYRFEISRIELGVLIRECRTSAVDVKVMSTGGQSRTYFALRDCCADVRNALNAAMKK